MEDLGRGPEGEKGEGTSGEGEERASSREACGMCWYIHRIIKPSNMERMRSHSGPESEAARQNEGTLWESRESDTKL